MRRLSILRHAKAQPGGAALSDYDRPLAAKGQHDLQALAEWMKATPVAIDRVLVSPSARTRETYEWLRTHGAITIEAQWDERLYLASTGDLLHCLQEQDDRYQHVLVIGHNPGLHELVLSLAATAEPDVMALVEIHFPTSTLAELELDLAQWPDLAPLTGRLVRVALPEKKLAG